MSKKLGSAGRFFVIFYLLLWAKSMYLEKSSIKMFIFQAYGSSTLTSTLSAMTHPLSGITSNVRRSHPSVRRSHPRCSALMYKILLSHTNSCMWTTFKLLISDEITAWDAAREAIQTHWGRCLSIPPRLPYYVHMLMRVQMNPLWMRRPYQNSYSNTHLVWKYWIAVNIISSLHYASIIQDPFKKLCAQWYKSQSNELDSGVVNAEICHFSMRTQKNGVVKVERKDVCAEYWLWNSKVGEWTPKV